MSEQTWQDKARALKPHEVAARFPLLADDDRDGFDELVSSIQINGLIHAIVLDGDVIIDGRNRLAACLEADVEPRYVQFREIADLREGLTPDAYALTVNLNRRSLDDDRRAAITAWYFRDYKQRAQEKCKAAGKNGGRPKKTDKTTKPADVSNLDTGVNWGISPVDVEEHAPEKPLNQTVQGVSKTATRLQVAETGGVSARKAQQALEVQTHAPELAEKVMAGAMPLAEAAKQVKAKKPPKPRSRKPPPEKLPADQFDKLTAACSEKLWKTLLSYRPRVSDKEWLVGFCGVVFENVFRRLGADWEVPL